MTTDHTPAEAGTILAAWQQVCRLVDPSGFLSPASIVDRVAMLADRVMAEVVPGDTATEGRAVPTRSGAIWRGKHIDGAQWWHILVDAGEDDRAGTFVSITHYDDGRVHAMESFGREPAYPPGAPDGALPGSAAASLATAGTEEEAEDAPMTSAERVAALGSLDSRAASPQGEAQGVPERWRIEVSGTDDSQGREVVAEVGTTDSAGHHRWEPIESFLFRLAAPRAVAPVGNVDRVELVKAFMAYDEGDVPDDIKRADAERMAEVALAALRGERR